MRHLNSLQRIRVCSVSGSSIVEPELVPSGLVAVFKPQNWTSSDVVAKVKYTLQRGAQAASGSTRKFKIKVGHGGTLDPLAEGVLVLGVGQGTKLMGDYLAGSKAYKAVARLGEEMDTLDSTGSITEMIDSTHVTATQLQAAMESFRGNITQVPPMFSALKKDGKKLYELARAGIEVERESRQVTVYHLSLTQDSFNPPYFGLDVSCSGGFYVRSLISDLARACNARAHMTSLLRTQQGPFTLPDCLHEKQFSSFEEICKAIKVSTAKIGLKDLRSAAPTPSS